jgi:uncharacterized protein YndB with AHSA1/START domain
MTDTTADTRSVVVERDVPHPRDKVWRALTQPELIAEWLMKNDFEAVVGRRFHLRSEPMPQWDGVIACEVLAVQAPERLAYSWAALGVETVVTLTLTATDGGTHVRMEQSGFLPSQAFNIRGAEYGWRGFLAKLAEAAGKA